MQVPGCQPAERIRSPNVSPRSARDRAATLPAIRRVRSSLLVAAGLLGLALAGKLAAQDAPPGGPGVAVGGRLHLRYATSPAEGERHDFRVLRARARLDVRPSDLVELRLQPELARAGVALEDAYLRLSLSPGFHLSLGQFKRASTSLRLASSADVPIVDRDGGIEGAGDCPGVGSVCSFSRLAEELSFDGRDTGLRLEGALGGGISYMATLTSGEGIDVPDLNDEASISGRLEYGRGAMTVGGFAALHDYPSAMPEGGEATAYAHAWGADIEVGSWREGFHLLAGLVHGVNWKAGPGTRFTAVQGLATHYLTLGAAGLAGVEPMLRVSWADAGPGTVDGRGTLVTPGLTVYISGRNGLVTNLDIYSPAGAGPTAWSIKVMTLLYY